MPKIAVTMVEHVLSSAVTLDGRHAVLWLRTAHDGAIPLAVPCEQLPLLIDCGALALSQSERTLRSNFPCEGNKAAVTWWNAAVDPQSRELTLDLTFGSGGTLSFALSEHMANALRTTLQLHYESNPADSRTCNQSPGQMTKPTRTLTGVS
jgi:hypothetical protein